ncbi:MAG: pyridoxamine 5'-phosphate oxidase family protein [Aureispira sp.]
MAKETLKSASTTVKRAPKRGTYDATTIHQILDNAYLGHIGFVANGQPFVIPTLYGRLEDSLYLHGATTSRLIQEMIKAPICLTVSLIDGLVLARSAFHHSMNYRSVVLLGQPTLVETVEEKELGLKVISDHLIPNRWEEVRAPNAKELKATSVLKLLLTEGSAKIRTGDPVDDKVDYDLDIWAGQIPLQRIATAPVADALLKPNIALSPSVQAYVERHSIRKEKK